MNIPKDSRSGVNGFRNQMSNGWTQVSDDIRNMFNYNLTLRIYTMLFDAEKDV